MDMREGYRMCLQLCHSKHRCTGLITLAGPPGNFSSPPASASTALQRLREVLANVNLQPSRN